MRQVVPLLLIAVTLPPASCVSRPTSASLLGDPNVIAADELDGIRGSTQNLWEVVQQLRPHWLVSRGATMREQMKPVVYMDGVRVGEVDSLRDIPVFDVRAIRWISAPDATLRYGTGHAGGVIAVVTGG